MNLELYPVLAQDMYRRGHELGNHSFTHPNLAELDPIQQKAELERTDLLITQITGNQPKTFRAPFLQSNDELKIVSDELAMK